MTRLPEPSVEVNVFFAYDLMQLTIGIFMKPTLSDLLPNLMRPVGAGIPVVSTGSGEVFALQCLHYKNFEQSRLDPTQIDPLWRDSWTQIQNTQVVMIGVPLDTGAGIRRGAAYGPQGIRRKLLELDGYKKLLKNRTVLDLGDILVNPHLLHDEMLSDSQKLACQEAMYPQAGQELRKQLAVSALSQLKQVLLSLLATRPDLRFFIMGGDHSVAWPVSEALAARYPGTLAIVQPDAHTDLLPARLGVKYCFGTWSYHANDLLGRGGKLVQLGIRQSGRDKAHWESTMDVKQYWASEIRARPEQEVIDELVVHLKTRGVKHLYFSNDIDGTDESEAAATGTPANEGLSSEFLLKVIRRLGDEFELVGADIMEVAPDLGHDLAASEATCELAARYSLACLEVQIKSRQSRSKSG